MAAATYSDLKVFHPEFIRVMFNEIRPPVRLYQSIFRNPTAMGLYSFSQGKFDDPFAMLPPVEELEDAKSMFADQGIEDYKLQQYRGFVDVSNKVIRQFVNANNMPGLIQNLQDRYAMVLREGFENTMEYTCFKAMDDKAVLNTNTKDWSASISSTTADDVLHDLQKARQNLMTNQRTIATTCILNAEAESDIIMRKDLANRLYLQTNSDLETGSIGRMLGMDFITQPQSGMYTDSDGNAINFFQPSSANKPLAYVLNPEMFGYPVVFGAPEFNVTENYDKDSVRIYVNAAAGFVYRYPEVEKITC